MINRTHAAFNIPIWPAQNSNGEWRPTEDYCGLNEVMALLGAAVPSVLQLPYKLESKAAKCMPQFISLMCFSQSLWKQSADHGSPSPRAAPSTPGDDCPRDRNTALLSAMGCVSALDRGETAEHLWDIDNITMYNNPEVIQKGKQIVKIHMKAGFYIPKLLRKGNRRSRF